MKNIIVLAIGLATALPFAISQNNTVTLDLDQFDEIELAIDANLEISEGNNQSVTISGPQALVSEINTNVWDNRWEIKLPKQSWKNNSFSSVTITVVVESLRGLGVSGNGSAIAKGRFSKVPSRYLAVSGTGNIMFKGDADNTHIALSGSGYIDAEASGDRISCALSGSGNIDLKGTTTDLKITTSGSGNVGGPDLKTKNCKVVISGSSVATAHVSDRVDMTVSGSGQLHYKGNPTISSKSSNGSSCTQKIGS